MSVNTPEIYIELFGPWGCQPDILKTDFAATLPESFKPLNTFDYDGIVTYQMEVIGFNANDGDLDIVAVDEDGNELGTKVLAAGTVGTTGYEMFRSRVTITPTTGDHKVGVKLLNHGTDLAPSAAPIVCAIPTVRVVIKQIGATKTRIQIPLIGAYNEGIGACDNPTGVYDPQPCIPVHSGGTAGGITDYTNKFPGSYPFNPAAPSTTRASDKALTIWQYDSSELATVSKFTFRASAAAIPQLYTGRLFVAVSAMSTFTVGAYSKSGGVYTLLTDASITWNGSPIPDHIDLTLDPSIFVNSADIYFGIAVDGGAVTYTDKLFTVSIPGGSSIVDAHMIVDVSADISFTARIEYTFDVPADMLTVCLWNITDDEMVTGSELTFQTLVPFLDQSVDIDPDDMPSGKEYELRAKSPGALNATPTRPDLVDADLWATVTSITALTVWQRVTRSFMAYYNYIASVPAAWGTGEFSSGDRSIGCRVALYLPTGATVCYEATGYVDNQYGDYGDELTLGLVDMGTDDSSGETGSDVAASLLTWTFADRDYDRHRRRSGALSLTNGNRYVDAQRNTNSGELWVGNGFLVVSITGSAPPAVSATCTSVTASIDSETMAVTGSGVGADATGWRVIRESDSAVMDNGSGDTPTFAFTAVFGETYQLQFIGTDLVWSTSGCTFTFGAPAGTDYLTSTLVRVDDLMEGRAGWFLDQYTPRILTHYGEEGDNVHSILCGGADGVVYQLTGDSDDGEDVECRVLTPSRDQGDLRYHKLYGDIMLDADAGGVSIAATPKFDNNSSASAAVTVTNTARTQTPVPVGAWVTARNIALDLAWQMNGFRSYLYAWEPRWTEEGGKLLAYSWETCHLNHGCFGYLYLGYLYLTHISTADLSLIITVDEVAQPAITIANSGGLHLRSFIRLPVMKGKLFKYRIESAAQFRIEADGSELLVKEWGQLSSYGQPLEWKRVNLFSDVPIGSAE